ncbi:hypothetical protein JCM31826_17900 [Thermaurantimonas aggregans]|uniref:Uncharacterized protein n=2 Tax=Thermaurantimonas aggregans TaxID=2173829 RepID=A0A401XMU5_9FLAO|nr:hypothetical protein JCM31826_17900 [Thermaurantimonas aggregans]
MLVMHLHAMLPHEHCVHPLSTENHFFETPTSETPEGIVDFLKKIFSFDIGENHLDNFKNNSSYKSFQFAAAPITAPVALSLENSVLYSSSKITIPKHERLHQYALIDAHCFRGPPVLG